MLQMLTCMHHQSRSQIAPASIPPHLYAGVRRLEFRGQGVRALFVRQGPRQQCMPRSCCGPLRYCVPERCEGGHAFVDHTAAGKMGGMGGEMGGEMGGM
jgi:hypothetical protein